MRPSPLVLPSLLLGCSPLPTDGDHGFTTRLLDTIPADTNVVVPPAYSRDGLRVAYVARKPEGDFAVCGSWKSKTYAVV
jgi:hypothetical protein